MKALVVGGGPTGLTLAIDLARRGVRVRIVDKAAGFFEGSRGDGIQPRTLEVFDDLGVLDAVLDAGAPSAAIRVHLDGRPAGERRMVEPREPTPDVPHPNPWVLGQSQLEGILRARLSEFGVRVELGAELVGLAQDSDGVTARLSTDEVHRVDYLVGADGGASFVRKAIGVAFPGTTDESFRVVVGDVAAPGLDPEVGHWFAAADDPMSGIIMTPLPGTGMFQLATPLGEGDDASLETMQAALDRFSSGVRLTGHGWSTVWRPNVRLAERYRVGRVFLAGDAAHVHPPTGGQGMNTGVQDAYNLGWKLAGQTALDSYETERRAVAAHVLGVSTDLLQRYAEGREDAHRRGEESFGLNITYRATDAVGGVITGDRAPDAPVLSPAGKRIRLFDLFRGPHFTRLNFGGHASVPDDREHTHTVLRPGEQPRDGRDGDEHCVVDAEGHAYSAYAASPGDSFLVRPDGYLA
ncbi:3-(3-hydroxyphenyl)propionate hydroxylase [Streptomyces hygroscopicus]|uniref:FAD-dependent monooxygenase n=1 Tax=Streptomyces hygroscopicus TaxID=1912 RepID=UPI0022405AA5|nr:FAD-dependent monooxygenase [Streptomyces hygroscopicus]MCW7941348.1 3-(3-hydroxyphenyl)propionate hydroxylase [Streptomyces hygroscopicus]